MPCKLRDATCRCHSVGQPGAQRCRAAHLDEQAHAARLHVCLHARGGQVAADCDVQLQRARACVLAQRKLPATLVLLHQARALLRAPRRLAHVFLGSWAPWHRLNLLSGDAPSQQLAGEQRRWLRFVRLCKVAQQAGLRKRPAHAPRALGSPCVAAAAAARRLGARPWRRRPRPRRRGRGALPRAAPAGASPGTRAAACGRLVPCACTARGLARLFWMASEKEPCADGPPSASPALASRLAPALENRNRTRCPSMSAAAPGHIASLHRAAGTSLAWAGGWTGRALAKPATARTPAPRMSPGRH